VPQAAEALCQVRLVADVCIAQELPDGGVSAWSAGHA
jgi:hypothetical protein